MRSLFLSCLSLACVTACSGASSVPFGPAPSASDNSGGGASSGGGSSSSGGAFDATMDMGDSNSSGSSGGGMDDASKAGDGPDGASDAPSGADGADAASPGLLCPQGSQASYCSTSQTCCITTTTGLLGGSTQSATCQSGSCTGTSVRCASQADCKQNEVCCGTERSSTAYQDVSCATTCTSGAVFGPTRVQFCAPTVDTCPSGTTCQASTVVQGYTVCR